jgi:hypothetical protein
MFTYKNALRKETFYFEHLNNYDLFFNNKYHIRKSPRASRSAQCTARGPRHLSCASLLIRAPKIRLTWTRFIHTSLFPDIYAFATCMARTVCKFCLLWRASVQLLHIDQCFSNCGRGPQVVLGFCPCGPLRLNISQKKTEK